MDYEKLYFIANQFFINSKVLDIKNVNSGLINNTYIVEHFYNGEKSKFILQSLSNIFVSHEIVNVNHELITNHMKKKIRMNDFNFSGQRWEVPNLIKCQSNNLFAFPFESNYWRAMIYIDQTFTLDLLKDKLIAYQTGVGLGKFHFICADFDYSRLGKSIKNFHNTQYYIDQYIKALNDYNFNDLDYKLSKRLKDLINDLSDHIDYIHSLLRSLNQESINYSVIHGDPKLSNFLFDVKYNYVVSLIDLDTVSSGYFLTDIADCIRSICNVSITDQNNRKNVNFDLDYCKYFLRGYLSIFKVNDGFSFRLLPEFIYLIIFELTIRFLTDYLQSNTYFKISYETHNLFRAEIQYQLLCSFLNQIPNLLLELQNTGISSNSSFVSDVQKFV
tara:strand:- start:52 stop:1215 length:1164 start_codon:yes stop_codon:yes gene_type:complete